MVQILQTLYNPPVNSLQGVTIDRHISNIGRTFQDVARALFVLGVVSKGNTSSPGKKLKAPFNTCTLQQTSPLLLHIEASPRVQSI